MSFCGVTGYLTCFVPGAAMSNLAATYNDLGRHHDALMLAETALEFRRRVLPDNHPDTGAKAQAIGIVDSTYDFKSF
jgi:hypothetical protein